MATKRPKKPPAETGIPPSVDPEIGVDLLKKLIGKAGDLMSQPRLSYSDKAPWESMARDYLVKAFGSNSPNVNQVLHAQGDGGMWSGMSDGEIEQYYRSSLANSVKILGSCIEQLETEISLAQIGTPAKQHETLLGAPSNRIFVVHGHDEAVKQSVARTVERMGLEPIILHEKPNAGRTLIEKFSDYADVHFAVVLLTADDEGRAKGSEEIAKSRARQNVIFELGYFIGRLSRSRVCALYEKGVELPSDYSGVLFIPLDEGGSWKFSLVSELKAAGFEIDANRIFQG